MASIKRQHSGGSHCAENATKICKTSGDTNNGNPKSSFFEGADDNLMHKAVEKLSNLKHKDPVLILTLPPTSNSPSTTEDGSEIPNIVLSDCSEEVGSLLGQFIYPLPVSEFLSHCFRKKAVCIQQSQNGSDSSTKTMNNRVKDICENYLFNLNVQEIFDETSSENVFLWLHQKKTNNEKENIQKALKSIELSDPQTAYLLHKTSNHASYCRAPPELEQPLVGYLLRDTGLGCGQYDPTNSKKLSSKNILGRGEVEVFIGTEEHVTDWHYDFQENFTIQLSGSKKWTLRQGSVKNPIRGMTPHYQCMEDVIENQIKTARLSNPTAAFEKQENSQIAFGDEDEVILRPGDVLYHPAGIWHRVETLEPGVAINVSLMGTNYANLVCNALEHVLVGKDEWRETVCISSTYNTTTCSSSSNDDSGERANSNLVTHKMNQLLKKLPGIVEEFCKNGGASNILPPVLTLPPKFENISHDDDDDNGDGGSQDNVAEGESIGPEGMEVTEGGEKDSTSKKDNGDNEMQESDELVEEEEEDEIVDIISFEGPDGWDWKRPSTKHHLVKNPLATLTKMQDVTSFFSEKSTDKSNDAKLYILNVNFAGNEMIESAVRVVFHDDSENSILKQCCELEEKGGDVQSLFEEDPIALIYFGYLTWAE